MMQQWRDVTGDDRELKPVLLSALSRQSVVKKRSGLEWRACQVRFSSWGGSGTQAHVVIKPPALSDSDKRESLSAAISVRERQHCFFFFFFFFYYVFQLSNSSLAHIPSKFPPWTEWPGDAIIAGMWLWRYPLCPAGNNMYSTPKPDWSFGTLFAR